MDIHKKSNKENARPKLGQQKVVTSFIKRTAPGKTAPLQSKNDGTVEKRAEPTKKAEQRATRAAAAKPAAEAKKPQTLTQTFLSQQSASYKKLLTQGPKPAPSAPPKSLRGTYKGKVVQSKVDCFRKPGEATTAATTDKKVFAKPAVPKAVGPTPATLSRVKSKSVTTLPVKAAPAVSQIQPRRPKSVTDVPLSHPASKTNHGQPQTVATVRQFQVIKRPATARPVPTASASTRPVTGPKVRPVPATAKKANEQSSQNVRKPPVTSTNQRPSRKPVTSTLSHTRVGMETVEERRAKLAEWLAAKGKTLKRPPIHNSAQPTQRTRPFVVSKADLQQNQEPVEPHAAAAEPSPVPEAAEAEPRPALEVEAVAELETVSVEEEEGPVMNTTLDMVDNCELDLPEVDVCMENLVVNLCEALEAMETPSTCQSAEQHAGEKDTVAEQEAAGMKVQVGEEDEEDEQDEIKEASANKETDDETSTEEKESSGEDSESEMEADSIEGSESGSDTREAAQAEPAVAEQKVKAEDEDEEVENCATKTPECNGASVVKFSVRTTPYLQSVKKRIDGETSSSVAAPSSCSSSRRQRQSGAAAIGDLKFLTPVRRSRRIERQSARLPAALTDHDPCVTSLAELARLEGGDGEAHVGMATAANAYIYRRNPALLDELPDGDLTRL
ncbi:cytoskeleton-associated protein 2 [Alosa sapidissima]|uniref:cytoskeleton-associated protein 2 n=1 Tax=Alosa sapidissima TaxID=34773 RepID=UPI001C09E124|nr:cytoskeleton-associated protein 2 [Alosa sapidissima]